MTHHSRSDAWRARPDCCRWLNQKTNHQKAASTGCLRRTRLVTLLAEQPACIVAMEACATSHHWGRVALSHGHEVRLVPAAYVKPFVKRL